MEKDNKMKYAVVVKPISPQPWTEQVRDTRDEAEQVKLFIEAHLRGVEVHIVEEPEAPPRSYRH
jgi:hypothetical protein